MTDETIAAEVTPDEPVLATDWWPGRIEADEHAMWCMRKLRAHRAEIDRIRRNAQAAIDEIQSKAAADEKAVAASADWHEAQLVSYMVRLNAADPKLKTYKLPLGNLTARSAKPKPVVADKDAFAEWARTSAPEALRMTPALSVIAKWERAEVAESADDPSTLTPVVVYGGEVVPGIDIEPGGTSYGVSLTKGEVADDE